MTIEFINISQKFLYFVWWYITFIIFIFKHNGFFSSYNVIT